MPYHQKLRLFSFPVRMILIALDGFKAHFSTRQTHPGSSALPRRLSCCCLLTLCAVVSRPAGPAAALPRAPVAGRSAAGAGLAAPGPEPPLRALCMGESRVRSALPGAGCPETGTSSPGRESPAGRGSRAALQTAPMGMDVTAPCTTGITSSLKPVITPLP